jgi:hypothetical protein
MTDTTRENGLSKAANARRAKIAIPDGKKAWRAIADMEEHIHNVERAANALRVITSSNLEEREQDARYLISEALRQTIEYLDKKYGQAWDATWGFVHGPDVA